MRPGLVLCLLVAGYCPVANAKTPARTIRVVSLAPVISEWTAEILGPARVKASLIGVSEFSDYPESVQGIQTVGPYPRLNIEKIASLRPDLVLASAEYNLKPQLDQLMRLKLQVKVLPKERFRNFGPWIRELGTALGEPKGAKMAEARWKKAFYDLGAKRKSRIRYFLEVQHAPLIAVGGGSFITEALARVGFDNVMGDLQSGYPKVSLESVIARRPEAIFVLDHGKGGSDFESARTDWARFPSVPAVSKGRIEILPGDDFARCSLRLLIALKRLNSSHEDGHP